MEHDQIVADVRFMYERAADDSRFMKQQQWTGTYYVLLIHGALLGYASFLDRAAVATHENANLCEIFVLIVVAWAAAISGLFYIQRCQSDLDRYRGWIQHFADPNYAGKMEPRHKIDRGVAAVCWDPRDRPLRTDVSILLQVSMVIGAIFVSYALLLF